MANDDKTISLSEAAQQNVETGVWLLCKEFLITAIQDRRLERGHLRVLASLVLLMNRHTAKAWPDRATLATMSGMSVASVSNILTELRKWNYLIVDREFVEAAGGRKLMVYTFGNIDHETLRSEITKFAERMQRDGFQSKSPPTVKKSSPPTVNFTAHGEPISPPTVNQTSPPTVVSAKASPPAVTESSPPTVDSNYREGTTKKRSASQIGGEPPADLLADLGCAPPAVIFADWKANVGFKPLGHPKFETISDSWISSHVPNQAELSLARDFVRSEIEQYFAEPPLKSDGTRVRLHGFLASGFTHRWGNFRTRNAAKTAGSSQDDLMADLDKIRRQQLAMNDE